MAARPGVMRDGRRLAHLLLRLLAAGRLQQTLAVLQSSLVRPVQALSTCVLRVYEREMRLTWMSIEMHQIRFS
jgi:hypothetical protein